MQNATLQDESSSLQTTGYQFISALITSVCNKPTRSTQPCIPLGSLNRVPALTGWGKGGNVTSAGWQVTLCDPIWHVSSRSSDAFANCYTRLLYFTLLIRGRRDRSDEQSSRQFILSVITTLLSCTHIACSRLLITK